MDTGMRRRRYAAFLRAVNVGRGRTVKMEELRKLATESGLCDVRTYIQSGNLVFSVNGEVGAGVQAALALMLSGKIGERFGFIPEVIVKGHADMERIMGRNPLLSDTHGLVCYPDGNAGGDTSGDADSNAGYVSDAISDLYVVILAESPTEEARARLYGYSAPGENFAMVDDALYVRYGNGYGRSKFTNAFIEKKLGVSATTRNWATMTRILGMLGE